MLHRPVLARQPGKRAANRLRLGVPAGLMLTHRTRRCLIDDISANGARIRVEGSLVPGRTALLCFHQLRLYATIMWCRAGECGLRFDRKLPQEDMEGFLWIVTHPKSYARLCRESGANDWAMGLGG